jgi:hypothetical protein
MIPPVSKERSTLFKSSAIGGGVGDGDGTISVGAASASSSVVVVMSEDVSKKTQIILDYNSQLPLKEYSRNISVIVVQENKMRQIVNVKNLSGALTRDAFKKQIMNHLTSFALNAQITEVGFSFEGGCMLNYTQEITAIANQEDNHISHYSMLIPALPEDVCKCENRQCGRSDGIVVFYFNAQNKH